jgi:tRNA(Leu) C34 or U34 (ribose-2'-O)-methylase TrmL
MTEENKKFQKLQDTFSSRIIDDPPIKKGAMGITPAVFLHNPKYAHNVGAAVRACSCFGVEQLWWSGNRIDDDFELTNRLPREERMKGYKSVDMVRSERPFEHFPNASIIGIELKEGAEPLHHFEHPEEAVYVFGPEDGSLTKGVRVRCHRFVVIPSHHCLNLAAAINVVLYDRRAKRIRDGMEEDLMMEELLHEHRGPI